METRFRNKKSGFTVAELVIVIAIIAILSAILIPVFSGLIKRAHRSADQQLVAELNTVVIAADADGSLGRNIESVKAILAEENINVKAIQSKDADSVIYYDLDSKLFLIYDKKDGKILFPSQIIKKYGEKCDKQSGWYALNSEPVVVNDSSKIKASGKITSSGDLSAAQIEKMSFEELVTALEGNGKNQPTYRYTAVDGQDYNRGDCHFGGRSDSDLCKLDQEGQNFS